MAKRRPLNVWLDGRRVATFASKKGWDITCAYSPEALSAWDRGIPLLSCSLPLGARPQDAKVFANGLLPEGQHRAALAAIANVPVNDTHALLARFGRDVAGALVITEGEPKDRRAGTSTYTRASLEQEVAELPSRPLAVYPDSELSIAGLQDKLLLVDLGNGQWGRPLHGQPSTHILKRDHQTYRGLVDAEAACLDLAYMIGLTTVQPHVEQIAGVSCLFVPRFDRIREPGGVVHRVHQEDVCQALARDPDANKGRGKYEDAGGPRLADIAAILDRHAADPLLELNRLVSVVTFTVCIGNADAHGKNLALLHREPEHIVLAPLYDTVPTRMWDSLRRNAAMSVNGVAAIDDIGISDIADEARTWRYSREKAAAEARATLERIIQATRSPGMPTDIGDFVRARAEGLLSGCPRA